MSEPKDQVRRSRPSLFADLRSGDAGPSVRVFVSLAIGFLLWGLAAGIPFVLAVISSWPLSRKWGGMSVSVSQEVVLGGFLVAAPVYLAVLYWVWSRPLRRRGFWLAGAVTIGIWLVTIALCIGGDVLFSGEEELIIMAIICVAIAATLLSWVNIWRRYGRGRPVFDTAGQFDVRCTECGYSMIGLYDTACPECGERLTLDQLLLRQGFEQTPRDRVDVDS